MLSTVQRYIPLIARTCLTIIFLRSGFGKITDFSGTYAQMQSVGIPLTTLALIGAIVFELAGALSVIIGYKARWGAILLVLFMIPTTLIFHTNFAEPNQINQFLKNLSIIGGLLLIVAYGAGPLSLDAKARSAKAATYLERNEDPSVR